MEIVLIVCCAAAACAAAYAVFRLRRAERDYDWLYNAVRILQAEVSKLYEGTGGPAQARQAAETEAREAADARRSREIEEGIMNILSYSATERTRPHAEK